jgi:cell division protease FtsH
MQLPTEDRYLTSRSEIMNRLCVLLGGRCAEEMVFDEITTGACDDLSKATNFAQKMVTEFGMSEKLGPITLRKADSEVFLGRDISRGQGYSESTAQMIDEEVKRIVRECHEKARSILDKNKKLLDTLAQRLIEKESIDSDELNALFAAGAA